MIVRDALAAASDAPGYPFTAGTLALRTAVAACLLRRHGVEVDPAAVLDEPSATEIQRDGHRVRLAFDPQVVAPAELIRRVTARHAIRDLFVENPPIETIVARLYAAHGRAHGRPR